MDTIAALATPPLSGAVGVIRISGTKSLKVAGAVFSLLGDKRLTRIPPREMCLGEVRIGGALLDRPLGVYMPAPRSFTGEDMFELHLHGSMPVIRAVLEALYAAGARPAEPGEFTRRAFLHGKMNLSQAESIMDVISAETRDAARNAAGQLEGRIGRVFAQVYEDLSGLLAQFLAVVDYPEEDIPEPEDNLRILREVQGKLQALLDTYERGRILREGVGCVLLGRPNVGKSSLLNVFAGHDRAIVSSVPGTTRDTLEITAVLGGVKLRMTDCAGIRAAGDEIEMEGVRRTRRLAEDCELMLCVLDGSQPLGEEDRAVLDMVGDRHGLILINKCDLPQRLEREALEAAFLHVIPVSARTGEGIGNVDATLRRMFDAGAAVYDGSALTNARQRDAIQRTLDAVEHCAAALASGVTPDAALSELETGLGALGELTGRRVSEDIVRTIFARFCVGK